MLNNLEMPIVINSCNSPTTTTIISKTPSTADITQSMEMLTKDNTTATIHVTDKVKSNGPLFIKGGGASQRNGVQNLRNLWNQRIMANAVQAQQQNKQHHQQQQQSQRENGEEQSGKRTQSISCLNSMTSWRSSGSSQGSSSQGNMQINGRAQSLHDCSQMHIEQIASVVRERDRMQREKDNFYKYKTAEQAARHRSSVVTQRRLTVSGSSDDDIFTDPIEQPIITDQTTTTTTTTTPIYYSTKIAINDNELDTYVSSPPPTRLPPPLPPPPLPPPRTMRNNNDNTVNNNLSATGGSEHLIATDNNNKKVENVEQTNVNSRPDIVENGLTLDSLQWLRGSRRLISSSTNNVVTSNSTLSSGSTRRYSFKTHTRTYPIGGKMTKDSSSNGGTNIVARLTQQFNEIIQNDRKILNEVKRKNGVLMARGGHIYKVVENTEQINSKQIGLKRSGSRVKETTPSSPLSSAVQKQIRRFEPKDQKLRLQENKQREEPQETHNVVQCTTKLLPVLPPKPTTTIVPNKTTTPSPVNDSYEQQQVKPKCEETSSPQCNNKINTHENSDLDENMADMKENDSRAKQRKQKYAKIYEKFRIRSPFSSANKHKSEANNARGFDKILDALEEVDHKLKVLSVGQAQEHLDSKSEDFEKIVVPNSSFVHQSNAAKHSTKLTQAVNVALVNSINANHTLEMHDKLIENTLDAATLAHEKEQNAINMNNLKQVGIEDSIYEPIAEFRVPETSTSDVIYQTVTEMEASENMEFAAKVQNDILDDYESIADSVEQSSTVCDGGYDSYELLELSKLAPPPPPPPLLTQMSRNTTDELPELPKPKRRLPKSPMPGKRLIKPALPSKVHLSNCDDSNHDSIYHGDDRENIYCTIKNSAHCYESLHLEAKNTKTVDSISLASNAYESISNYRRSQSNGGCPNANNKYSGSQCGSTLTLSSDHKTNSLYEDSLAASLLHSSIDGGHAVFGFGNNRNSRLSVCSMLSNSTKIGTGSESTTGSIEDNPLLANGSYTLLNRAASDNSDEWIDMTDTDEGSSYAKISIPPFIVVRERFKVHRSPDWSKRVRDKRLHQNNTISYTEDDSDHYYETLSPLPNNDITNNNNNVSKCESTTENNEKILPTSDVKAIKTISAVSDEYDSFDTDTDDVADNDDGKKNPNDSGVDMCQVRLPDPPTSTNQVYAIVRKFKNFISNKKLLRHGEQHHQNVVNKMLYENTSQFYVCNNQNNQIKSNNNNHNHNNNNSENTYENMPNNKAKNTLRQHNNNNNRNNSNKNMAKKSNGDGDDAYENTEFHTLRTKSNKTSDSFKSRLLRKSLNLDMSADTKTLASGGQQTQQLISPMRNSSSTFYVDDVLSDTATGSGILDSGFSDKSTHSCGNQPTTTKTITTTPPTTEDNKLGNGMTSSNDALKFNTVARKSKKFAKKINTQRRRTTIGIRPHEPPPPPPAHLSDGRPASTTLWYAECGVFKNTNGSTEQPRNKATASYNGSHSSWYAEAGLYQTSGVSVASSSGSSGVSTGNEAGLGDENSHSMFLNEPLYQIYNAAKLESISRDIEETECRSNDGYEEIRNLDNVNNTTTTSTINGDSNNSISVADDVVVQQEQSNQQKRPSALQLVEPKNGPSRTLWSEIPEVINSCILYTLSARDRALQEAKFEIITSEASYLKSLNLLRSHFMNHPLFRDTSVVSARDRKALFGYITPVHECSERLLTELEQCWQDNVMLMGLSKRIFAAAEKHFNVYVDFCEHQGRMDRTLRRLKEAKTSLFAQNLELLEMSPNCCGLNLHSFLMLPMQRITRLPLLIDAVFSKMQATDDEYDGWKMTLAIMNKLVTQCNEAANACEQAYEIDRISRQLEFPTSIRALAIAPMGVAKPGAKPRFLVKRGELVHLIWRGDDAKLTFGKKFSKVTIYVFLFSDLLVLTKRKNENQFTVFDYCPRNMLTTAAGDDLPQLPTKDIGQSHCKNLILMTLLENHERKTIEMLLSCPSVSEQERWLTAMRPPLAALPGEKLYEQWDCPQVIAKHAFVSNEPDALNLDVGDVVNVTRKLADGWYQGERIRDGTVGWFPGTYTDEVNSAHVRARNLKQRYRLLTFTATYLESQKRK